MTQVSKPRPFHLAGIVPVAGQPLDFNFPWHDCLQPIGHDYLAVERAVVECAYAGCKTIWVVCHDDMQPLIRYRLGDYVQDPVYLSRHKDPGFISENRRPIPIHYVPIHPKDRDRRDCLAWSVLYGANVAHWVSRQISKWVCPSRFYTAFPYGLYDPQIVRPHRRDISSLTTFYLSHDNKTIIDGEYLGFSFDPEEFKKYRRNLRAKGTGMWTSKVDERGYPCEKLPVEERYSARHFSLDTVFECAILDGAKVVETPWYYRADNWEGLRKYLGSENLLDKPSKDILSYHEYNRIGE